MSIKEGRGLFIFANGDKQEGEYKNGYEEGVFTYTFKDGRTKTKTYQKGRLISETDVNN